MTIYNSHEASHGSSPAFLRKRGASGQPSILWLLRDHFVNNVDADGSGHLSRDDLFEHIKDHHGPRSYIQVTYAESQGVQRSDGGMWGPTRLSHAEGALGCPYIETSKPLKNDTDLARQRPILRDATSRQTHVAAPGSPLSVRMYTSIVAKNFCVGPWLPKSTRSKEPKNTQLAVVGCSFAQWDCFEPIRVVCTFLVFHSWCRKTLRQTKLEVKKSPLML